MSTFIVQHHFFNGPVPCYNKKKRNRVIFLEFYGTIGPALCPAGDLAAHGGSWHDGHPHEPFPRAPFGPQRLAGHDPRRGHPPAAHRPAGAGAAHRHTDPAPCAGTGAEPPAGARGCSLPGGAGAGGPAGPEPPAGRRQAPCAGCRSRRRGPSVYRGAGRHSAKPQKPCGAGAGGSLPHVDGGRPAKPAAGGSLRRYRGDAALRAGGPRTSGTLRQALEQAGAGQIRIFAKIENLVGVAGPAGVPASCG